MAHLTEPCWISTQTYVELVKQVAFKLKALKWWSCLLGKPLALLLIISQPGLAQEQNTDFYSTYGHSHPKSPGGITGQPTWPCASGHRYPGLSYISATLPGPSDHPKSRVHLGPTNVPLTPHLCETRPSAIWLLTAPRSCCWGRWAAGSSTCHPPARPRWRSRHSRGCSLGAEWSAPRCLHPQTGKAPEGTTDMCSNYQLS